MRAIVQDTYGPPEVLRVADVASPTVGPKDVLIDVEASAVTGGDRRLRSGDFPGITWLPGRLSMGLTGPRKPVPGSVFAGRVAEVGADVERFQVGDAVFGTAMNGAYAPRLAMPADGAIARMPSGLDFEQAAPLAYGGGTALHFLQKLAALNSGEQVCILGASGGVGHMAVQLARHMGAEVTAVCSERNHGLVRDLGAQHVVDYRGEDFRRTGRRYDVILDTIGASSFAHSREALAPAGRYLSLLVTGRLLLRMLAGSLLGPQRAITGVAMEGAPALERLAGLVEAGALRPHVDRVFPLERIAEAHAYAESGRARGAVVVRVAGAQASAGDGARGVGDRTHGGEVDLAAPRGDGGRGEAAHP
ncbi:MAG: NAD(P)-dependent alcohol dehydrogenase [Deltaproteobacteria bacterium]|nr:NAD(P)-dependent alcohol dehydrogenase [Deltaproteobacteria bacterium]